MQFDCMMSMMGCTVQHGPNSERAYLLKLGGPPAIVAGSLADIARTEGYSKAVAKIPEPALEDFADHGFEEEARVPGMFEQQHDGLFVSKYLNRSRKTEPDREQLDAVRHLAHDKAASLPRHLAPEYVIMPLGRRDIPEMVNLFKTVFRRYPFPVHDAVFVEQTMREGTRYFGARTQGKLVAVASAEVDMDGKNAEMTDFATLPAHRGKGLASHLLATMEAAMRTMGIHTGYTIARAVSPGMNITFARAGYSYSGRLPNNTCIGDGLESMNVWWKHL